MSSAGNSIDSQIEFWARAALDNPDLPVSFVAESLAPLAEPHKQWQFLCRAAIAHELNKKKSQRVYNIR